MTVSSQSRIISLEVEVPDTSAQQNWLPCLPLTGIGAAEMVPFLLPRHDHALRLEGGTAG